MADSVPYEYRGNGWEAVLTQGELGWRPSAGFDVTECYINGKLVAWIEKRPAYCDRGHWKMNCGLPDIDSQDSFPRYYMDYERAVLETEAFLRWRLWKQQ